MTKSLLGYLSLPRHITDFEASYLKKTNRIALVFFALHVPALTLLAWLNRTGPTYAAALSSAVLAGPALAVFALANPRRVSMVHGVAAMAMGALLVHFGQGPVQIEMHFYFFALIAMLAIFANPMVILAAATTVALHHLALWFFIRNSVFNYDAPVWVVAVHAAFVVLESVGAVYIARSFFDNVIGLETVVLARTAELTSSQRDMRLVLDNVEQGFVTIDRGGRMSAERSAAFDQWFGTPAEGENFFSFLQQSDPDFVDFSRLGWEEVIEAVLPLELTLQQMPRTLTANGRIYDVTYKPIGEGERPARFLTVVADVTAKRARERADVERREAMHMLERMLADRSSFIEFFEDATILVSRITSGVDHDDTATLLRSIHTLKGNAAVFGLHSVATLCHELEDWLADNGSAPPPAQLQKLVERWTGLSGDMERLVGTNRRVIQVEEREHAELESAIRRRAPTETLLRMVHDLKLEPTQRRLETFVEQAQRIATRLDKPVEVVAAGNDFRIDAKHWANFWSAFVHAVRNALDHGIESSPERIAAGKPEQGRIEISTECDGSRFVVAISDDGRGVDWDRISDKAKELGLPTATRADLVTALFAHGVSTTTTITELSGRGVGMAALLAATREMGGTAEVQSERGRGATFRFVFAAKRMAPDFALASRPPAAA